MQMLLILVQIKIHIFNIYFIRNKCIQLFDSCTPLNYYKWMVQLTFNCIQYKCMEGKTNFQLYRRMWKVSCLRELKISSHVPISFPLEVTAVSCVAEHRTTCIRLGDVRVLSRTKKNIKNALFNA